MITAGVDVGLENIKIAILEDGKVIAKGEGLSGGGDRPDAIGRLWAETLDRAGLAAAEVGQVIATGKGKYDVSFAQDLLTESVALAASAKILCPDATTILDVGADETRVVPLENGAVAELIVNQKCAAGVGLFLEYMARRLHMSAEEMGKLEGTYTEAVNDGCVNFAELEALGLLNRGVPPREVALAVIDAAAVRVNSTINDVYQPKNDRVALCGGVAKNGAFVKALKKISGIDFVVAEEAAYAGAIGAAVFAAAREEGSANR